MFIILCLYEYNMKALLSYELFYSTSYQYKYLKFNRRKTFDLLHTCLESLTECKKNKGEKFVLRQGKKSCTKMMRHK